MEKILNTVQQVYEIIAKIKTNIMIFLLLSTAFAIKLNNELVHIAIDCGSDQAHQAPEGFTYKEDQYFFGSSRTADYTYNEAVLDGIKYTLNSRPYLTERHGETFGYKIPITDGEYTIILQFVELYFTNENHRQFDISIGKRRILQNFAILDGKPKAAANDIFINVNVKDSQVFYKDAPCEQGYEDGKIVLRFERGAADLPKIDALIIVKGNQADQVERQELIDNWETRVREQKEKQKKAQLQDIDKSQNIEPLADSELIQEPEESLFAFLTSPLGLGIALVLALALVCLRLTDTKKSGKQKRLKKPNLKE